MAQMSLIANRSRTVGGVPTSLSDVGFTDVGLDDSECAVPNPNPSPVSVRPSRSADGSGASGRARLRTCDSR